MLSLVLIKQQAVTGHDSHIAGGIHLFGCAAATLARELHVHVVTAARKSLLLHHAVQHNLMRQLTAWRTPRGTEAQSWQRGGVWMHAAVLPDNDDVAGETTQQHSSSAAAAAALLDVLACVLASKLQQPQQASSTADALPLLLDADSMQQQAVNVVPAGAGASQEQPFMAALVQTLRQPSLPPTRLLMLVQNVHHLPFGPQGTAPRSAAVLQAWGEVQGVVCVSHFVSGYLQQHAVPLLGLDPSQLHVVHPGVFGVWSRGPFSDLGTAAAGRLWPTTGRHHQQQQQQQQLAQAPAPATPVVGMLKLTREKGADVLLALCRRLPHLQFVAVAADCAGLQQQVAAAGLQNIRLLEPVGECGSAQLVCGGAACCVHALGMGTQPAARHVACPSAPD
jgi:hypothetical protein